MLALILLTITMKVLGEDGLALVRPGRVKLGDDGCGYLAPSAAMATFPTTSTSPRSQFTMAVQPCHSTLHNVSTVVLGRGVPGCVDRERGQLGEIGSRWHVLAVQSCTQRFLCSSSNAGKRAFSRSIRRINKATAFAISSVYSVHTEEDS